MERDSVGPQVRQVAKAVSDLRSIMGARTCRCSRTRSFGRCVSVHRTVIAMVSASFMVAQHAARPAPLTAAGCPLSVVRCRLQGAVAKAEEITASTPDAFMLQQFQNPNNPKVRGEGWAGVRGEEGLCSCTHAAKRRPQRTGQANCTASRYKAVS